MNIKIFLILGIIILFFIFLLIQKHNKTKIINFNNQKLLNNHINNDIKKELFSNLTDFTPKFIKDVHKLIQFIGNTNNIKFSDKNIDNELKIIEMNMNTNLKIDGCSGIVCDTSNDDLIIFNIAYLKRYQIRIDRNEFSINKNIKISNKEVISVLKENIIIFCMYIEKLLFLKDNKNLNLINILKEDIKNSVENLINYNNIKNKFLNYNSKELKSYIDLYNNKIRPKIKNNTIEEFYKRKNSKEFYPIYIESGTYEYYDKANDKINNMINTKRYNYNDINVLITDLQKFYYNYLVYENIYKCFDDKDINKCKIKYNYNLPSYNLDDKNPEGLKGLENLNFDYQKETLKHTYLLDDITKHTKRNMGIFQPFISDNNFSRENQDFKNMNYIYKNTETNKENKEYNVILDEEKINNLGNPNIKGKSTYVFLENTGIGMYYYENLDCVFVPDPLNNRIQIMECLPNSFKYNGEFGNVKYITKRSLPYYQGSNNNNILYNTSVTYEPIFNTNENKEIRESLGYRCLEYNKMINILKDNTKFKEFDVDLYFRNIGPIDMFNIETNRTTKLDNDGIKLNDSNKDNSVNLLIEYNDKYPINGIGKSEKNHNYECEVEYSTRRANINSRQQINLNNKDVYFKKGHFYHLLEEYNRVLEGKDNKDNKSYLNPHLLNVNVEIKTDKLNTNIPYNPITETSLAYRKLLVKYITETDIGQEFGQLFRPQSIFYDDDDLDFGGKKYYIVDTFHHCIQCFERTNNTRTDKGTVLNFESSDKIFNKKYDIIKGTNIKKGYYLYDNDWNINDYKRYNDSDILSLGVRQCIIEFNNKILNNPPYLDEDWAKKYGQIDSDGNATVKLYRWTSGLTKKKDIDKYPFFYSQFTGTNEQDDRRNSPGTGEFSYPTDIVIFKTHINININRNKNEEYKQNILCITDTGNNRVSIFKKYKNKNNKYRFRFYKFLIDSKNLLINPISITKDIYSNLYILCMTTDNKNKIYKSELNILKSLQEKELIYNEPIEFTEQYEKAVKIRIDSRNIMYISGGNLVKIKLNTIDTKIKEKIENETQINIYKSGTGMKLNIKFPFSNELFINRYRLLIQRINLSKNKEEILLSKEYKYNNTINNKNIIYINKINKEDIKEDYWVKYNYNNKELFKGDIYNKNNILISNNVNTNIKKEYKEETHNYNGEINKNILLEGVEDYIGKNVYPNSSYKYRINLMDYSNIIKLNTEIDLNIIPLGLPNDIIYKEFIYNNSSSKIKFTINYGSISNLHLETMKYNPLSVYILKSKHSRSMDITNKYVNVNKGQMIQLIVPKESKFLLNKFSQPKFGKLFVNNIYDFGDIRETRKSMKEGLTYTESNISIFYLANEGIYKIPKYDKEKGMKYIDDYFILGDNVKTFYTKIKYRVRIYIDNENNNVISFDNPQNLTNNLKHYNRTRGIIDETSLSFLKEESLWEKIDNKYNNNRGTIEIEDNNIERNQTYEYHFLIGNDKIINSGINSFYYTTKSNIYIDNINAKFENLFVNGVKKSFIRLKWYCMKYQNSYLPYNFFIIRRQITKTNNKINKPKEIKFTEKMDNFLVNKNGSIILKPNLVNSDFNKIIDLKKKSRYRIKFNPFNTDEKYTKDIKFIIYDNNIKLKTDTFTWEYNKRFYDFTGNIINITINLLKKDILNPFKIVEIQDINDSIEDNQKSTTITSSNTNTNTNININLTQKELDLFYRYKTSREKGIIFTLEDDSFNPNSNTNPNELMGYNFNGYNSELYLYLNQLDKRKLLEVFDNLKEKVILNSHEVNMRMDGTSGMLRSGGRDILIEKIRHLVYIFRENENKNESTVNCTDIKLTDLFNNQDKTLNCETDTSKKKKSDDEKKIKEYNKQIIENQKERTKMIKQKIEESNKKIIDSKLLEQINKNIEETTKNLNKVNDEFNKFNEKQEKIERNLVNNKDTLYPINIKDIFKKIKETENNKKFFKLKNIILNRRYRGPTVKIENTKQCIPGNCWYPFEYKNFENFLTKDLIKFDDLNMGFREVDFFTFEFKNFGKSDDKNTDFIYVYMRAYSNISEEDYNENLVEDGNTVLIYREQFEEKLNKVKDEYNKQLDFLKKEKLKYKIPEKEKKDNVDIKRLISQEEKLNDLLKQELKNSKLSEWSFLKDGMKELFIEEPITEKTKLELLKYYAIKPDLVSLNNKNDIKVDKDELKNLDLISYTQLIEVSDKNNYKYEYRIISFPTGINLLNYNIKEFYGIDYMTQYQKDLPLLGLGEFYSEKMELGDNVVNIIQEKITDPVPKKIPMVKSKKPIIKFFEPKEGSENSIIKIVGVNLDDLEYICLRDIKVKILKKNKRFIKENGDFNSYDEYIIKPPSLKELNKECWQSLEKYKVLVWGYYNKLGLQIRTEEKGNKNLFYTYTDKKECPEGERLSIPE